MKKSNLKKCKIIATTFYLRRCMELDFNYKFIGDGNFVRIGSKYKNPTFNTCVVKHLHFLFIRRNLWRIINEKND